MNEGKRRSGYAGGSGTAWLPLCHLRSLAKGLSGFVAGIQGVRQTRFNLAQTSGPPQLVVVHPLKMALQQTALQQLANTLLYFSAKILVFSQ